MNNNVRALAGPDVSDALDAVPDPVIVFAAVRDADGALADLEYRFTNRAAHRLFGRDVIGHTHLELYPSIRERGDLWPAYERVLETGEPVSVDVLGFDDHGLRGDFVVNAARFGDGLIVTVRDVGDRQQLLDQLQYERDFTDATLRTVAVLVVVVDAGFRIVRFNRQCEAVTGYREAEVLGRHVGFFIPASERSPALANAETTEPGRPVAQVNHWISKSGELRLIRWVNTALTDEHGVRTHLIAAGTDITEQSRAEAELARRARDLEVANRDLERSNADLEQFAYVASHDLREPLATISGPLEFVLQNYEGRVLDEPATEFLQFAVDGSRRMQRLIDDLLAYSRVGRVENELADTDAGEVVQRAISALGPAVADAEITVDPLPKVRADADQLTQAFSNLIGNAVKFVAPSTVASVHVAATRVDSFYRFTVTDNGIGVAPDQRGRVFDMFSRLQASHEYPGTGLGLAIVKRIVERHGGEVGVEAAPAGSGSRFWFTLPAAGDA